MAQMNKRPERTSRRGELEKELIGEITDEQTKAETGRFENTDDKYTLKKDRQQRTLSISQGVRRRHPDKVLHQYHTINRDTESAESQWEKALLHEDQRADVPEEYKIKQHDMIANQMGLVTVALDNYARSKGKFSRTQIVGV
jgi:hypothetical protein